MVQPGRPPGAPPAAACVLGPPRSSYRCRFFVLPCCFFDFVGRYHRRQSRKTQYREYLDFVREVGQACGFLVQEDCLRIPSTKRVRRLGRRQLGRSGPAQIHFGSAPAVPCCHWGLLRVTGSLSSAFSHLGGSWTWGRVG